MKVPRGVWFAGGAALGGAAAYLYVSRHVNRRWPLPPAIEAERRTFEVEGAGLASAYVHEAVGPAVLLLHGVHLAASAFDVRPLFEDAARRGRAAWAPDLPGFGMSDRSARAYSPALYVAFTRDVLRRMTHERGPVHVVALGATAGFAARAVMLDATNVRSLTMIAPEAGCDAPSAGLRARVAAHLAERPGGQALFDAVVSRKGLALSMRRRLAGRPREELADYAYATTHQPDARHAPLRALAGVLTDGAALERARESLHVPVHVVLGDNAVFKAAKGWRTTRVQGTCTLPHWERPEAVLPAIATFWDELDAAAGTIHVA